MPSLSVLIVSFNSRTDLERTLPALLAELDDSDELIVIDNASQDGTRERVAELAPAARLIAMESNEGFEAACNAGAAEASGDLLLLLNPDARPLPGFGTQIRRPWTEDRGWDAWMGLVACDGGATINTTGNPVHFTGFAWAGGHGLPVPDRLEPAEVPAASGACFAIPRETWIRSGGFPERFFLYHEDIDLSMRLRLAGGRIGIEPSARVDHDYEFAASDDKLRWLELNRLAFVIRVYPAPLLALVAPALLLTELALLPVAIAGGWGRQKLGAWRDLLGWLPRLLRERHAVQATRTVKAREFAAWLTPDLDSPYFGRLGRSRALRGCMRGYWAVVLRLLGSRSGRPSSPPSWLLPGTGAQQVPKR